MLPSKLTALLAYQHVYYIIISLVYTRSRLSYVSQYYNPIISPNYKIIPASIIYFFFDSYHPSYNLLFN